ncbi:MAG: GH3 auxin-responsive promoter family protein, partial [Acidobacteriia bacterium]|nr:GH3 auxin-responsive promoter family protein [Terriglobia bacterium]
VKAGENYEIVVTPFHGGALMRYKVGDMIRIQSLRDDKLGIELPQMAFERRVDDFLDFYVVNFTERSIWQAIESTGVPYEDWIAYKDAEHMTLNIGLELKNGFQGDKEKIAAMIYNKLTQPDSNKSNEVTRDNDLTDVTDFEIKVDLLPKGTFAGYIARRRAEGADMAHLKPPHVNPPEKVLSILAAEPEETIIVTKTGARTKEKSTVEKASIL